MNIIKLSKIHIWNCYFYNWCNWQVHFLWFLLSPYFMYWKLIVVLNDSIKKLSIFMFLIQSQFNSNSLRTTTFQPQKIILFWFFSGCLKFYKCLSIDALNCGDTIEKYKLLAVINKFTYFQDGDQNHVFLNWWWNPHGFSQRFGIRTFCNPHSTTPADKLSSLGPHQAFISYIVCCKNDCSRVTFVVEVLGYSCMNKFEIHKF